MIIKKLPLLICKKFSILFQESTVFNLEECEQSELFFEGIKCFFTILTEIDIDEISEPQLDSLYVDYDEDNVVIEGSFTCVVSLSIETSLSRERHHKLAAIVVLSGNITIEFKINYDKENNDLKRSEEEINISNVEISKYEVLSDDVDYSDIACFHCEKRPGSYFTNEGYLVCTQCSNYFEPCTRCGLLFEDGTLGGYMCDNCRSEGD